MTRPSCISTSAPFSLVGKICGMANESIRSSASTDSANTRQTFLYFGALTLFIYMATPAGYLVDIQTSYMLKNQLHATATEIARFRLLTGIPVYFAFVFGLVRDQ